MKESFAASHPAHDPELGRVVGSCCRLSGPQELRARGQRFGWLIYWVLYPLAIFPYLALINIALLVAVLAKVLGYSFEFAFQAIGIEILGGAFLLIYSIICWFAYVWPRRDYMVLHEKGMRIRVGFNRLYTSFEAVQGMFVGRASSVAEQGLTQVIGLLKPGEDDYFTWLGSTAVTIVFVDGRTQVFRALLTRFEPADLENFVREMVARNPRLRNVQ